MSSVGPRVALTFDAEHPDRPGCRPGNADRILDALAEQGVRATFFVQGRWALSQPRTAARIASDGHVVGHHSHYHARMTLLSDGGVDADVADGREAIVRVVGVDPTPWFRLPFGDGHDDPRLLGRLEALGFRNVHWDVELEDWEPWRTGPKILDDAVAAVDARDGRSVLLLHTWPDGTADAVTPMIERLRAHRAEFVTVDELDAVP